MCPPFATLRPSVGHHLHAHFRNRHDHSATRCKCETGFAERLHSSACTVRNAHAHLRQQHGHFTLRRLDVTEPSPRADLFEVLEEVLGLAGDHTNDKVNVVDPYFENSFEGFMQKKMKELDLQLMQWD